MAPPCLSGKFFGTVCKIQFNWKHWELKKSDFGAFELQIHSKLFQTKVELILTSMRNINACFDFNSLKLKRIF